MNDQSRPVPQEPTVSALMIARNRAATLPAAIASVQRQGGPAWELVIVDDGSTDGTREIAEGIAAADHRVRVMANGNDAGIPGARNTGVTAARGEYLAICDSDDLSHPNRFARQVAVMSRNPHLGGVGSRINVFQDDPAQGYVPQWRWGLTGGRGPFPFPTAMLRTSAIREVGGFDSDFSVVEDLDLCYRMAGHGWAFELLDDVLVDYRFSGSGSMATDPRGARLTLRAQWRGLIALRGRFTPAGYATLTQSLGRAAREALASRAHRTEAR